MSKSVLKFTRCVQGTSRSKDKQNLQLDVISQDHLVFLLSQVKPSQRPRRNESNQRCVQGTSRSKDKQNLQLDVISQDHLVFLLSQVKPNQRPRRNESNQSCLVEREDKQMVLLAVLNQVQPSHSVRRNGRDQTVQNTLLPRNRDLHAHD
ncbi:hypothetical protein MATL_G00225590 [Megalops atlanticus]|uniref:Uncharacterized protein n=1 Tax=Megalops atlanticus TaxID=7932 RepID=A0A9D3T3A3_MEGAT|nr:hypothetical protein MATL_G00225590 [Megalops atlanticus]